MNEMTMVERVALAISGGDDPASILAVHRARARLAIAAMRDATDDMAEAGSESVDPDNDNGIWDNEHNGPYLTTIGAKTVFRAMIDAAQDQKEGLTAVTD
jgi:hypothetical protein